LSKLGVVVVKQCGYLGNDMGGSERKAAN
jgi:hypothetical protein